MEAAQPVFGKKEPRENGALAPRKVPCPSRPEKMWNANPSARWGSSA